MSAPLSTLLVGLFSIPDSLFYLACAEFALLEVTLDILLEVLIGLI